MHKPTATLGDNKTEDVTHKKGFMPSKQNCFTISQTIVFVGFLPWASVISSYAIISIT